MKLTKIAYIDTNWELSNLALSDINLIVAKNSTGKSRTVMTIDLLVKMLTQKRDLNWGGRWNIEFLANSGEKVLYEFGTSQKMGVTTEKIRLEDEIVAVRYQSGRAILKNRLTGKSDTVYPPTDKLLLHTNRDIRKYPFLEEIIEWAEQSYGFKFGNIAASYKINEQEYDFLTSIEDIPQLYNALNKESKEKIIQEFNGIGFDISEIKVANKGDFSLLLIKEGNVDKILPHYKLSQGMFRALAMTIFLEYLICSKNPALVIIDDLCEGLDYERAKNLGKLIFEKCENTHIQLIATSNDSFLMDIVPVKYWNVLQRTGKKVSALNIQNSAAIFQKFNFTGLSNFDFFASDFLIQNEK